VPPLIVASVPVKGTKATFTFYAHYDGQPVDPAQWSTPPWEPVLRGAGPEARLYGRSSSDDKAPIIAMLAALDALRAARAQTSVNLKFVFEGEEEAGSPHLAGYINQYHSELATDGWLLCDGPVHQSRHTQLYFGARGVLDLEITVYGPARPLHSGHYGNWAPNPIVTLTHLIDSMRDADARILIEHFYDDVTPLTGAERDALSAIPPYDDNLKSELALGRTEGSLPLNEAILQPALNLRGVLGGHVGEQASNTISTEARASIDFRLVPAQTPERVRQLVEAHVAKQGFLIVHDEPDAALRTSSARPWASRPTSSRPSAAACRCISSRTAAARRSSASPSSTTTTTSTPPTRTCGCRICGTGSRCSRRSSVGCGRPHHPERSEGFPDAHMEILRRLRGSG
jgi:acetylornithine deacetylase/succinyl-diaminopimelate desuccinylase-like protein